MILPLDHKLRTCLRCHAFLAMTIVVYCPLDFKLFAYEEPTMGVTASLSESIVRALTPLERGATGSAENRQCFTCHSQALPIFALASAKSAGFHVDDSVLERQVQHTYDHLKRGVDNYREGKGQGGDVLTAGYALWALDESGFQPDDITEAVAHYLLEFQKEDARWHHHSGRPPSSDSDFSATYLALRGLEHFGSLVDGDAIVCRKAAVASWLLETKALDTEDHVFRLGSFAYLSEVSCAQHEATQALLGLQRADGGWAQNESLESDAYATGSAMVMLMRHGAVANDADSIQRGASFLVRNQLPDGTWHVVTRAKGFQTYFESGFPHEKDQFISIAASSWATLALLLVTEPASTPKN